MSIPIIVNIEAGEKECEKCHLRFGSYCRHFGDDHFEPLDVVDYYDDRYCRLPACLAAEKKLKGLVEAVAGTETLVSIYGSETQKETMCQALAAIKED